MDLNGDGLRDVISGSWPGQLFFFEGLPDGGFLGGARLVAKDGSEIEVGRATSVAVADWDGDGDRDLLVGEYFGRVLFLPRMEGLAFGAPVQIADLARPGQRHAGPHVADWDRDGQDDVLVGTGGGGVWLFRGRDRVGLTLGPPENLIPEVKGEIRPIGARPGEVFERPQGFAKVCTYDWDGDGDLDLLVGDRALERGLPPRLTPIEAFTVVVLDGARSTLRERSQALHDAARSKAEEELGSDWWRARGEQKQQLLDRTAQILRGVPEYAELAKRTSTLLKALAPYQAPLIRHGYVWVYQRSADPGHSGAESGDR